MDIYYAFSDESGLYEVEASNRFLKNHPYYVRATVLFKVDEYADYQKQVHELNMRFSIPPYEEIKWSDIWSKERNQPRNDFVAQLPPDAPRTYIASIFEFAKSADSVKLILTCTKNGSNIANNDTMFRFHLQEAFQRVNSELENNGFATFIIDELPSQIADQAKTVSHWLIDKGDIVKYTSLYSGVLFEKSNLSAGIQLADYIAGIFNSFLKSIDSNTGNYQYAKELFFSFIKPRLRRSRDGRIMGYGIREVTRDDQLRRKIREAL